MPTNQEPDQTPPSEPSFSAAGELTIANHTDHEVTYTITPCADGCDMVGDDTPVEQLRVEGDEIQAVYDRWTGADSLEHAQYVAEEVGIGRLRAKAWEEPTYGEGMVSTLDDPPGRLAAYLDDALAALEPHAANKPTDPLPPTGMDPGLAELYERIDATPWPELTGDEDASAFVDRLERERNDFDAERSDLRQKIEQLVEELRYTVEPPSWVCLARPKDALDAAPFLERLDEIFGGRSKRPTQEAVLTREQVAEVVETLSDGSSAWSRESVTAVLLRLNRA